MTTALLWFISQTCLEHARPVVVQIIRSVKTKTLPSFREAKRVYAEFLFQYTALSQLWFY